MILFFALFVDNNGFGFNLVKKIFNLNGDSESILLEYLRIPRVIRAITAGTCLASSGLFMQAVSKNSLAEPYITGISSGAGLAIVISILFFHGLNYPLFGFIGALISAFCVILFCGLGKLSVSKLILVGLSVNMFASSIISFAILLNPDRAYSLLYILSGGVSDDCGLSLKLLISLFITGMVLCIFFIPKLNFFRIDANLMPEYIKKRKIYTILMIVLSAFLSAISVFAAGILCFIGVISPLISKFIIGNDYRWCFAVNLIIGSCFVLFADFISRCAFYPLQIPLGLVIAFIGSPVFIFFLLKKRGIFDD